MREHDGVKYRIDMEDVYSTPTDGVNEIYKKGYVYYIADYDYDSPDWYDTESEAVIAAEHMIGRLDSEREGPCAEYDISSGYEDHD